jgi:hypothetical protein
MNTLRSLAENIITHLEATDLPRLADSQRLTNVELVESILVSTLTAEGFVQLLRPNGQFTPYEPQR